MRPHRARLRFALGPMRSALCVTLVASWMFAVEPSAAALGSCGQPKSAGAVPTASDALAILNASVDIGTCILCVCDVDASGKVMATDALIVLRAAIGLPVTLHCSACQTSTTSSSTSTSTSSSTTASIAAALLFGGGDPAGAAEPQALVPDASVEGVAVERAAPPTDRSSDAATSQAATPAAGELPTRPPAQ